MTLAETLSVAAILLLPLSPAAAQALPPPPAAAPASPWADTLDEGIARARNLRSRQILVSLSGKDCGPCDRMDALILPARAFDTLFEGVALVRLDWDSPDAKTIAERYQISAPPAWVWLTADGLLVGLAGGSSSQAQWFEAMGATQAAWQKYQAKLDREKADPSDRALVYEVAVETWKRGGEEAAEARFRRLAADPKAPASTRSGSLAYLATIELDRGRANAAEVFLKELLATSEDPAMKERAELRLADVQVMKKNIPLALQLLKKFRKDHPDSPLVAEANKLIAALQRDPAPAPAKPAST